MPRASAPTAFPFRHIGHARGHNPHTMRLSKATKEFNIATQRAVDTLKEHGHVVEANPNAKIDDAQYEILKKVFASDKAQKDEAEKLFPSRREEKRNEKADKPEVNDEAPAAPAETPAPAAETSTKAQPAAEETKTEVPEDLKPQVKVLGKIELEDNAGGKKTRLAQVDRCLQDGENGRKISPRRKARGRSCRSRKRCRRKARSACTTRGGKTNARHGNRSSPRRSTRSRGHCRCDCRHR